MVSFVLEAVSRGAIGSWIWSGSWGTFVAGVCECGPSLGPGSGGVGGVVAGVDSPGIVGGVVGFPSKMGLEEKKSLFKSFLNGTWEGVRGRAWLVAHDVAARN